MERQISEEKRANVIRNPATREGLVCLHRSMLLSSISPLFFKKKEKASFSCLFLFLVFSLTHSPRPARSSCFCSEKKYRFTSYPCNDSDLSPPQAPIPPPALAPLPLPPPFSMIIFLPVCN